MVPRRIRTIWREPGCKPTRTDGMLLPVDPRGVRDTQAIIVRTGAVISAPRERIVLSTGHLHRITHFVECLRNILVAVRSGHEACLERRRREKDTPIEGSVEETTEHVHIRSFGI